MCYFLNSNLIPENPLPCLYYGPWQSSLFFIVILLKFLLINLKERKLILIGTKQHSGVEVRDSRIGVWTTVMGTLFAPYNYPLFFFLFVFFSMKYKWSKIS